MIDLDGTRLDCGQIAQAARRGEPVELADSGRARAAASYRIAAEISKVRTVYGRSTGVGANRMVPVDDPAAHAVALLRSHATAAGPVRSAERVRAMLVIRLNQLAAGGSGAHPVVLDGLAAMIRADALPTIREHGGIGTGDLSALATTALALMGEGPTAAPLPAVIPFTAHDALPFLSSNAATLADAALACVDLERTAQAAVVVAALTFAAVDGNREAFSRGVDRVTPFAGTRRVNAWLRALTASDSPPARIQDPLGLRVLPQSQGAALDSLRALSDTITPMVNAPSENPVLLSGEPEETALAHHGGFHASHLQMALDTAVLGVAQTGQLILGRLAALIEPFFTRLPPFLGDGTPGASGVMILEYVAASALAELRAAATPAGLQSVTLSRGVEEDASFASLAAKQALTATENYRTLLACELVAAVRALRMRDRKTPDGLRLALDLCEVLPRDTADRDLTPDIETATALLPNLVQALGESP
ncbi:MAG: aromatic amino acid lyase [Catenulispora sp.]|nr:aromatic amino acid lyase [Catenulispora sp.]